MQILQSKTKLKHLYGLQKIFSTPDILKRMKMKSRQIMNI